jgi:hypothetical protein
MTSNGHSIRTIKLWIKAFIPSSYEHARIVPGMGEHAGKTMLTSLWMVNRSFLTDQRTFSSDIHAEARMHSEIEIDVVKRKEVYQFHHCYDTIEIDSRTGEEKCRAQGNTRRMKFHDFESAPDGRIYTMRIKAGSKNPCVKIARVRVSPNLDYHGDIRVVVLDDPGKAVVTFSGKIENYPAFEMYVSANNGEPYPVFQVDVAPNAHVGDLRGGPTRPVSGQVEIST